MNSTAAAFRMVLATCDDSYKYSKVKENKVPCAFAVAHVISSLEFITLHWHRVLILKPM